ncbi:hypothetical protein V1477_003473 [Vespula maculifrons]|uniref:Uncharacterized protein n=2 Tax=Vespula TaxID=7451 RepID=A0A834NE71_VESVU|nr:hypothetical protein HZH66_003745 [Vespula vulgaris]
MLTRKCYNTNYLKIFPLFGISTSLPNTTRLLTLGLLALVNNAQQLCYFIRKEEAHVTSCLTKIAQSMNTSVKNITSMDG